MQLKLRDKVKLYNIKDRTDNNSTLCPICDNTLNVCHIGVFCSTEGCHYVDGVAWLNDEEFLKFEDKIEKS